MDKEEWGDSEEEEEEGDSEEEEGEGDSEGEKRASGDTMSEAELEKMLLQNMSDEDSGVEGAGEEEGETGNEKKRKGGNKSKRYASDNNCPAHAIQCYIWHCSHSDML